VIHTAPRQPNPLGIGREATPSPKCQLLQHGPTVYANPLNPNARAADPTVVATSQIPPLLRHHRSHRCCDITDPTVVATSQIPPLLRHHRSHRCCDITDPAVVATSQIPPLLRHHRSHRCCDITDPTVVATHTVRLIEQTREEHQPSLPLCSRTGGRVRACEAMGGRQQGTGEEHEASHHRVEETRNPRAQEAQPQRPRTTTTW
jgi:hypothetical protein